MSINSSKEIFFCKPEKESTRIMSSNRKYTPGKKPHIFSQFPRVVMKLFLKRSWLVTGRQRLSGRVSEVVIGGSQIFPSFPTHHNNKVSPEIRFSPFEPQITGFSLSKTIPFTHSHLKYDKYCNKTANNSFVFALWNERNLKAKGVACVIQRCRQNGDTKLLFHCIGWGSLEFIVAPL